VGVGVRLVVARPHDIPDSAERWKGPEVSVEVDGLELFLDISEALADEVPVHVYKLSIISALLHFLLKNIEFIFKERQRHRGQS